MEEENEKLEDEYDRQTTSHKTSKRPLDQFRHGGSSVPSAATSATSSDQKQSPIDLPKPNSFAKKKPLKTKIEPVKKVRIEKPVAEPEEKPEERKEVQKPEKVPKPEEQKEEVLLLETPGAAAALPKLKKKRGRSFAPLPNSFIPPGMDKLIAQIQEPMGQVQKMMSLEQEHAEDEMALQDQFHKI